jgi:hypothetical protein
MNFNLILWQDKRFRESVILQTVKNVLNLPLFRALYVVKNIRKNCFETSMHQSYRFYRGIFYIKLFLSLCDIPMLNLTCVWTSVH